MAQRTRRELLTVDLPAFVGAAIVFPKVELPKFKDTEALIEAAYGFRVSANLAEKTAKDFETTDHTTIKQENTIKKRTAAFLANVGGNFTTNAEEANRPELLGQVQLLGGWNNGSYTMPGTHHLDAPERGFALLHSGTNEISIKFGKDEELLYPQRLGHVILAARGKYGPSGQDTDQNSRMKVGVTEAAAGNVYYQKLMGPADRNIGFLSQKWFATEVAKAHYASPNTGADGVSIVDVVYYDTNTHYLLILRNRQARASNLDRQVEKVLDGSSWEIGFYNTP